MARKHSSIQTLTSHSSELQPMDTAPASLVAPGGIVNTPSSSPSDSTQSSPVGDMNSSGIRYDDDNDDEEDICRICRNTGDVDAPLRYPCACSGSIKFVHQDCLLQWLNHSNACQCEVCMHPFSFSPVYAENAPSRLPFQEFVYGVTMKAYHVLQFYLRLTFVLSIWFLIIPFITFWIWRFSFVRNYSEAQRLFLSHIFTTVILTDCLLGFLLSASIVFIYLEARSLHDDFRHLREIGGIEDEDAGGAQGMADAGQMIRRNAENVEQMFDGANDGAEVVHFNELVGMQGPVFHLVKMAFAILACNMIFLGVVILIPFHIGRFILYHLSWLLSSASTPVLSTSVPLQALTLANIKLKNTLTSVTNLTSEIHHAAEVLKVNATGLAESSNNVTVSSHVIKEVSRLSDVTTLAVGYVFIFSLVVFYFGAVVVIRYTKGEPLSMGRFYGIVSLAGTVPSLFKQFVARMRHLMTMVKVAFLLVIELGVFPLMCGWWLDFCTVRMFGKSVSQRVIFFSSSPLASSLIHWAVGIVYMLQISIFVSVFRGALRNGVLYFLRDPADPNHNPFWDLIDDPVHKHARRVLLSVTVYGSLIVMLVFLPVQLAMLMFPSVFPLDISVSDPFTEFPANMLLSQICISFAVEHFNLKASIRSVVRFWSASAGWALGFVSGIVLDLLLAWMTLLIFNSAVIVVSICLGRALFNSVPLTHGMKCNYLYAFIIGIEVIRIAVAGVRYSINQIKTKRAAGQIMKCCSIVAKSSVLFSIWIFMIPVNSAVYRFAWLGCLGFSLLCFRAKRFHIWFTNLHNSIRDDRYLIGRRLHNFGEDKNETK